MAEKKEEKDWLRIILPRVLRAIFWGLIMGGEFLIPLALMPNLVGEFEKFIPTRGIELPLVVVVFVAFEVVIELLSGTILQYALGMVRAIVSMILLIILTNGGIMVLAIPPDLLPLEAGAILVTVDFRMILAALLIFLLLSIAKNLLQALDFLSEKAEEPTTLPELP